MFVSIIFVKDLKKLTLDLRIRPSDRPQIDFQTSLEFAYAMLGFVD